MIVCPNCNHENPDGATQCEACLTPLPATTACFNCGATVQADAAFCGQCGVDLRSKGSEEQSQKPDQPDASVLATVVSGPVEPPDVAETSEAPVEATVVASGVVPDLEPIEPLVEPEPIASEPSSPSPSSPSPSPSSPSPSPSSPSPSPSSSSSSEEESSATPAPAPSTEKEEPEASPGSSSVYPASTQLQQQSVILLHIRTNTQIELPTNLPVIHLGKPNDRVPPDIDVSGFPDAEVVSRIHADIRVEGDSYYIEDAGSSNGTYINNTPLAKGNRHRLRQGDRVSLGKGDLVSFLFKVAPLH